MPSWYPIMLKLEGRKCVVIGGGSVAQRKAEGLMQAQADVILISPQSTPTLREWSDAGRVRWVERQVEEKDLDGAVLVFAATDQPHINRWIAEVCAQRAIPVNIADEGEAGDFLVPAVLRQGDLVLTASTSGAGPALASRIILELADRYGQEYNESIEILRAIRLIVKDEVADISERRELLKAAVTDEALQEWREASWLHDKDKLMTRLRQLVNDRKG